MRSHGLAICDLYSRVRRQRCGDDRIRDAEPNAVGALLAERGPFPILLNGRFAREWRQHFGELPADGRAAVDQPPGAALEHARVPLGGAQRMVHRRQRSWLGSAAVIRSSSAFKSAATSTGNAARFSSGQVDTRLVPTAYQLSVLFHRAHIPRIPAVDQRHHQIYHVLADRGSQDQLPAPPLPLFNNSPTPGLLPSYHASMGPFIACAPPRFCCQAAPAYSPCQIDMTSPHHQLTFPPNDTGITALVGFRGPVQQRSPDNSDVVGTKGSVFYRAHAYHTKVPVAVVQRLIDHYTEPGDVVVDPFCGSGQTGVAAILSGRRAVLSDLSPAATHIARGYTAKLDPHLFSFAAQKIINQLSDLEASLYGVDVGRIEYTVWTDVYQCPACARDIIFWNAAVDHNVGTVSQLLYCPEGHGPFTKTRLRWLRSDPVQESINVNGQSRRLTRPTPNNNPPSVSRSEIPYWYPLSKWDEWREMWRSQHATLGIRTAADFYTDRNLFALAALWHAIGRVDDAAICDALKFAFTSIVNRASRRYQWHPSRPTNVLSSTMYVSSLNYEFNVFSLLRRKCSTITKLYEHTCLAPGSCEVLRGSATDLRWIPDESVDYVFTDPPFGSNIYYGDASFLWEAWLGEHTDVSAEAVVNKRLNANMGGKRLSGYEALMTKSLAEIKRILRPNAWASVQFHNSDDVVWSSLQRALETAGFTVNTAVVMDKGQASFKGLRHKAKGERVASFDIVMHLDQRQATSLHAPVQDEVVTVMRDVIASAPPSRRTTPWLHSAVLRFLLSRGASIAGWSFRRVEALSNDLFDWDGTKWSQRL